MERRTAPELWREAVRNAPANPAYLEEGPEGWSPVSWDEAAARIDALARGLLAHGVRHGDSVAVLSRTSVDWILLDWAIMSIGAVVVGLYPTNSAKECAYVLEHSETVLAFAEDDEQVRKLVSVRGSLPALREIVPFDLLDKLLADHSVRTRVAREARDLVFNVINTEHATARPHGLYFVFELLWRGVGYGLIDTLLLTVFPCLVAYQLLHGRVGGLKGKLRLTALMLPLVIIVTATYHLGYPQYRQDGVSRAETGNVLISIPTFATANPVGSIVAHVSQHVAAVTHSYESKIFNPPVTKA